MIKYSGFSLKKPPSEPIINIELARKCSPIAITSRLGRRYVINGVIKQVTMYSNAGMQKETPMASGDNPIILSAMLKHGAI
jgi:hypothetical protein